MAESWFSLHDGKPVGPIDEDAVAALLRGGSLGPASYVWQEGMADWQPVVEVPSLRPLIVPVSVLPPPLPMRPQGGMAGAGAPVRRDGLLGNLAAGISRYAELPTLSGVPIRDMLLGGLHTGGQPLSIEDELIVGTALTTPALESLGFWQFNNPNFIPGMIVIGSFVVPLAIVILFFEMNTPRNVSIYQVGKMFLLGGALSLILTMIVLQIVPGSGSGGLLPALLTGVVEETGKALTLRWESNGLLFGAAVGAGFAGFESAGYAFMAALGDQNVSSATITILIRGLLAPGGHVIWTAMVGSALWKIKKDRPFAVSMLFHPTVLRRWTIAVLLHGLWDTDIYFVPWFIQEPLLLILGWYIIFAIMKEALAQVAAAQQTVMTTVILAQGSVGA
jgi:RsiW-degrading membrane proteinase PrsW (M82 family)